MLLLAEETFPPGWFSPTGSPEGGPQTGSEAADCSQGRGSSGSAGGLCYSVEDLPAPPTAEPQDLHQDSPAQDGTSPGGHTKVLLEITLTAN